MFSEAVDSVISRSGRKDSLADIVSYVNQAVRECQQKAFFFKDLIEDELTPNAVPFIWTRPARFRKLKAVKYVRTMFEDVYPDFVMPGRKQNSSAIDKIFYYAASDYMVFSGVCSSDTVAVAYYIYQPRLKYYPGGPKNAFGTANPFGGKPLTDADMRPASYDEGAEVWSYYDVTTHSYVDTLGSVDADTAARNLVSNWLLLDHNGMIEEGGCAKIFKNKSDPRALSSFALYKSLQGDFMADEVFETLAI